MPKSPLQKQLEEKTFRVAVSYVRESAHGIKKLSSNELAHLNKIIVGDAEEPWRLVPAQIQIPTGQVHQLNVISNPMSRAREIVSYALETAGNGQVEEAAAYLYIHLVLEHLFNEANRRTAVLATVWLVHACDCEIDPEELLNIPVGDLRDSAVRAQLEAAVRKLVRKT